MKKFKIKTLLKTDGIIGTGKSNTTIASKEGTYDLFTDLKSGAINNTFEGKDYENSRMFFLNAMNQYEYNLNREFNE